MMTQTNDHKKQKKETNQPNVNILNLNVNTSNNVK